MTRPHAPRTTHGWTANQPIALIAAVALTIAGAAGLVYQLRGLTDSGSQETNAITGDPAYVAPIPLESQEFSFLPTPVSIPDLNFVDGEGRPVALSDFRGRPMLLNIWATWCLPCRREMPSLDRLQAMFGPERFLVLALSIDRGGVAPVKSFYEQLGLESLAIYVDAANTALPKLGLVGIPATLLIDGSGKEVGRKLGPAEWDSGAVVEVLQQRLGLGDARPLHVVDPAGLRP